MSFQQGLSVSKSFYVLGPPFEFGGLITLPSSLPLTATAAAAPRGGCLLRVWDLRGSSSKPPPAIWARYCELACTDPPMIYRLRRHHLSWFLCFLLRLLRICFPTLGFFDFEFVGMWFRATFFVFPLSFYLLCPRLATKKSLGMLVLSVSYVSTVFLCARCILTGCQKVIASEISQLFRFTLVS